jgi:hypothetical protein
MKKSYWSVSFKNQTPSWDQTYKKIIRGSTYRRKWEQELGEADSGIKVRQSSDQEERKLRRKEGWAKPS